MTSDRRELVAHAIRWDAEVDPCDCEDWPLCDHQSVLDADAALAKLEPWLLPELPDWVTGIHAEWKGSHWLAQANDYDRIVEVEGDGETPAAAIRDALEEEAT